MNDLRILHGEKNYDEFFDHALDIKPAKRNKEWTQMVESLGQDYLEELAKSKKNEQSQFARVKTLSKWPVFKNNEFFIIKRDKVFLKEITSCYLSSKSNCDELVDKIYSDYKHQKTFAFDLVKELAPYKNTRLNKWSFISSLVKQDISEFYCQKDSVFKLISTELVKNHINNKSFYPLHQECVKKIIPSLHMAMNSSEQTLSNMAYYFLKEQNKLTKQDQAYYQLVKYLNNDLDNKDELSETLDNLKYLGNNYLYRDEITSKILKLDPIPGKIYTGKSKDSRSKVRLLSRYFPELIDKYAKTCLDYLSGDKDFPTGNPTPHCHEFFKLNNELKLLPSSFTQRYKKATYFYKNP